MNPKLMKLGPGYVLYSLLDFVVDNYFPVVEDLDDYLKSIEHDLFTTTFRRKTVQHLYDLKRDLVRLRMAVVPMQDISAFLMHQADTQLIPKAIYPYLRDINDHVLRLTDLINAQGEMLKVAMDVNLAMVSVGQNEVVKRLAMARPDGRLYRARRFVRRHGVAVGASAAVALALLAGTGVSLQQAQRAHRKHRSGHGHRLAVVLWRRVRRQARWGFRNGSRWHPSIGRLH